MEQHGFQAEVRFDSVRKWRFDYAHHGMLVAVEIEGGVWVNGGHNRGSGFMKNLEKYNEAGLAGWIVLKVVPAMIEDGSAYLLVERALKELSLDALLRRIDRQ